MAKQALMNKKYLWPLGVRWMWLLLLLAGCVAPLGSTPYFEDGDPAALRLGNDAYALTLDLLAGTISSLVDKQTDEALIQPAAQNCLWAIYLQGERTPAIDSCSFGERSDTTVTYEWDATRGQLHLRYAKTSADEFGPLTAEVTVTPSRASWLDLQLQLTYAGDQVITQVALPAELRLDKAAIQETLVPTLPGVLLDQQFFAKRARFDALYPSWQGLFADYVAIQLNRSTLTLYAHQPAGLLPSAHLSLVNRGDVVRLNHTFESYLPGSAAQDRWQATTTNHWQTPLVRLDVGQPYATTMASYRRVNKLNGYANLHQKLGDRYATIAQAPLYKIEYDQPPAYWQALLPRIPAPGILHWVTYWQNGVFDEGYPDYLPPRFSETAALAALFAAASAQGHLNMPYTNPTWWDDEAPTVQRVGPAAIALSNPDGTPRYECVNVATPQACTQSEAARDSTVNQGRAPWQWVHGGYATAPYAPAVQARIATGIDELVTLLGSDLIFEDQVGVGNVHCVPTGNDCRDYSSWAPEPNATRQGWLDHTERHAAVGLMTEVGYDRMAAYELGFHGGMYLFDRRGETDFWWGKGYWRPYPFATMLLRDKVLFYQHNLAPETFTDNLATLRWNLAMGYQLSYGLNVVEGRGGPDSPWLQIVGLVQRELLAPHVDQRITAYEQLADGVTATRYGPVTVVANWQRGASYAIDTHEIAPEGFYFVDKASGSRAGAYTVYNGVPLPEGLQILVEVHSPTTIDLYRPIGNATTIVVELPATWLTAAIELTAHASDNAILTTTTLPRVEQHVTVPYHATIRGQTVDHYTLTTREQTANSTIRVQR